MYCGQCGKRVLDTMLFCPFCGSPIVIPDQEEEANGAGSGDAPKEARGPAPEAIAGTDADSKRAAAPGGAGRSEPAPERAEAAPLADAAEAREVPGADAAEAGKALGADATEAREAPERRAPAARKVPDAAAGGVVPDLFGDPNDPWMPAAKEPAIDAAASAGAEDVPFEPLRLEDPAQPEATIPLEPSVSDRPRSLYDDFPAPGGEGAASAAPTGPRGGEGDARPGRIPLEDPPHRARPERRTPDRPARRSNQTYIPVKDVAPNDMFMDESHPRLGQGYDPYDDGGDEDDDDFAFEEPEQGGFLQRHIRGMVGLVLLAMLLVIFLIWSALPSGQRFLAQYNLAWDAKTYDDLGLEAHEAEQYSLAAQYFERAVARDGDNYEYVHNAMVAYYDAGDNESALAMLKKCIEMNPDSAEPYYELKMIYPDSDTRPWEVQELLRQGYVRTGDEGLRPGEE